MVGIDSIRVGHEAFEIGVPDQTSPAKNFLERRTDMKFLARQTIGRRPTQKRGHYGGVQPGKDPQPSRDRNAGESNPRNQAAHTLQDARQDCAYPPVTDICRET